MKKLFLSAIGVGIFLFPASQDGHAAMRYKIFESSGNLIIETEGSLSLPTPIGQNTCAAPNGLFLLVPTNSIICTGPASLSNQFSFVPTTPFSIGSGNVFASSSTGLATGFGVGSTAGTLQIDTSYISGTPIVSQSVFAGATLATFGLTPTSGTLGTYTLLGSGDTITVDVVPGPVPGPLPVLGAGAAFGFSRRLRQRIRRSQASRNS